MMKRDVADLMADRGGKLGLVVEQRQQAARDEDVIGAERMGVGLWLVEDVELEIARDGGALDDTLADPIDQRLQGGRGFDGADLFFDGRRQRL